MRKIVLLSTLLLLLSLLTGCRSRDMSRFFIVTAMAVDHTDGQYVITLEGSSDEVGEDGSPKALLRRGVGDNPTQCFLDIQKQTGEYPYLRQVTLVILSKSVEDQVLDGLLGWLLNENGVRLNARTAFCPDRAGELLKEGSFESRRILKALSQGGGTLTAADVQLRDLAMSQLESGIDSCLPVTTAEKTEGLALFSGSTPTGMLEPRLVPVFMLAGGARAGDGLTVTVRGQSMAFRLLDSKSRLRMRMEGETPVCTLTLESHFRGASLLDEEAEVYERALRLRLERDARDLLAALQQQKCDAWGLGQLLYRASPKTWAQIEENWPAYFANCRLETDISVKLISRGRLTGEEVS